MKNSKDQKLIKSQFKELPYYGLNIVTTHSHTWRLHGLYDLDIFSLNTKQSSDINPDLQCLDKLQSN